MMKMGSFYIALIVAAGFAFCKESSGNTQQVQQEWVTVKEGKGKDQEKATAAGKVSVLQKWDMPKRLREISGLVYLDAERFAAIQDEEGIIFIYNRGSEKIEKEIPFAADGDYEDIALVGNTAYVVRSDGRLFEVDMDKGKSSVQEYKTPLTAKHNVEGLCFDKANNRLLLAIKDKEPGKPGYKGIYAFDLQSKKLRDEPVYKIDLKHEVFKEGGGKKEKEIKPSAIGIHPTSGDIYVTDGPSSRLLVMDRNGKIKNLYQLGKQFAQPEGITFSPKGEIFISNEGPKDPGNILQVAIE